MRAGGDPASIGVACRDDLLTVDGAPVPLRLVGAGDGLVLEACTPVVLAAGGHRLSSAPGSVSGIDIDRLVLASDADGVPSAVAPRGTQAGEAGSTVAVRREDATELALDIETDGKPFWLVLGQSNSDGWEATVDGATVGPRQLVDGYANGWLVTPDGPGTLAIALRWGPQRLVRVGLAASGVALLVCLAILWRTRRRSLVLEPALAARPHLSLGSREAALRPPAAIGGALAVGVVGLLVAPPAMALAAAVVLVGAWVVPRGVLLMAAVAPAALLISRVDHRPSLAWLAVLLLAAEVARTLRSERTGGSASV
jgi:hypothetical protein